MTPRRWRDNAGGALMRVVTGLSLLALALALVWVPALEWAFTLALTVMVGVGMLELYTLARALDMKPQRVTGTVLGALAVPVGYWLGVREVAWILILAYVAAMMLTLAARGARDGDDDLPTLRDVSVTLFGMVYVGWLGAHFGALHDHGDHGPGLLTYLIGVIAISDTGAYVVGSAVGRHKLAPRISPNKTWEGAAGAVVFATVLGAGVHFLGNGLFPAWPLWLYVAVSAVLSVAGQLGDLTESRLKREAGVKDSGAVFPGHGGVLDRCDGYLFAAPVLYYLVEYIPLFK